MFGLDSGKIPVILLKVVVDLRNSDNIEELFMLMQFTELCQGHYEIRTSDPSDSD